MWAFIPGSQYKSNKEEMTKNILQQEIILIFPPVQLHPFGVPQNQNEIEIMVGMKRGRIAEFLVLAQVHSADSLFDSS